MEDKYRKAYYPEGITMEERLFDEGERCTRIPPATWIKVLLIGFGIAVFAGIIAAAIGEVNGFCGILLAVGVLAIAAGSYGIGRYNYGLHCLERAELLYNTRLASQGNPEEDSEPKKPFYSQGNTTWRCKHCDALNSANSTRCVQCGKEK